MNAHRTVREDRFSTVEHEPANQFRVWKQTLAPLMDIYGDERVNKGFEAHFQGFDLSRMLIAHLKSDGYFFARDEKLVSQSPLDYWCLSLLQSGTGMCRAGDNVLAESTGSLSLRSLTESWSGYCEAHEVIYVLFRRDEFYHLADELMPLCHTQLRGRMAELLKSLILTVHRYLPNLSIEEIPVVVESISSLFVAAARSQSQDIEEGRVVVEATQFDLARQFIRDNVASPQLSPEMVRQALGISRRQLYKVFESHGGVATFIRNQRLLASHAAIENIADHRRISSIAYDYGFSTPSQFSRLFREKFGYSPSEAMEAHLHRFSPIETPPKTFSEWINQVRQPEVD